MNTIERWLSLEEISNHLGVSKDTVRSWIKKETIPFHKVGRQMHGLKVVKVQMQTNNDNWRN